jgi:multimeric flavodoxin WrbA
MSEQKRALVLIGSPKGPRSTSESLGTYLLNGLKEKSCDTEKVYIYPSVKFDKGQEDLLSAVDRSDILILVFPLYVDSLPSLVIEAMEVIAAHRKKITHPKKQIFAAITNCGFPEALQTDTALAICRRFAVETGMEWFGGLGLGMGGAIDRKPLEKLGFMTRNVRKSLDLAASALASDAAIPQEAVDLMSKRLMPAWVYLWFGNMGWKRHAKKNRVLEKIDDQPYQG